MTATTRRLALAFALLGLFAAGASTYVHHQLLQNPNYSSVCDFSATWSCTDVYQSRYGSVAGIPVALIGTLWFALVTILVVAAGPGDKRVQENVAGYLFAMSTIALASVLYLGYASFFVLGAACLFCVLTYVAVIGLFLVSGSATVAPMMTLPSRALVDLRALFTSPLAATIAVLFTGGAAAAVAFFPKVATLPATEQSAPIQANEQSDFERWYEALPRVEVPVPDGGAAVVVVKFNDYQCPPCRQSFMDYKAVMAKYRGQPNAVTFVTMDYPLEPECNTNVPREVHPAACEAAVAVRLARGRGTADRLEDWLFANQPNLTREMVRQGARDVAGVTDYDAKYAATLEAVKADIALGSRLGVRATPTFFINGRQIPSGALPAKYFDAAIAYELRKKGP